MSRAILVALLALATACGGVAGASYPTTPIADPIPMNETRPEPVAPAMTAVVTEPEPEPVPEPEPEPAPAPVEPVPTPAVHHDTHPATEEPAVKPKKKPRPAPVRVDIVVTKAGFEPKNVTVPRGKPVVLRFERQIERTCGTEVVMNVGGQKVEKDLPLGKPVEIAITFGTAGVVKYSCAMDMIRGTITVQ